MNRVWFSLSWIRWNFDQNEFQFTWTNSDKVCICHSVMRTKSYWSLLAYINIWKELLLNCLRDKAKIALFSKLSNFYFDLRPPGQTPGQDRGAKPRPLRQLECTHPRGWSGFELTDAWQLVNLKGLIYCQETLKMFRKTYKFSLKAHFCENENKKHNIKIS